MTTPSKKSRTLASESIDEEDMVDIALGGGNALADTPVPYPDDENEMTASTDPPPDIENVDSFLPLIVEEQSVTDVEVKLLTLPSKGNRNSSYSDSDDDDGNDDDDDDDGKDGEHDQDEMDRLVEVSDDEEDDESQQHDEREQHDLEAMRPGMFYYNRHNNYEHEEYDEDDRSDPPGADAGTAISSIGSVSARQSFLRKHERALREMSQELVRDKYNSRVRYTYGSDIETNVDQTSKGIIDEEEETEISGMVDDDDDDDADTAQQRDPAANAGFRQGCSNPCGKYELAAVLLSFLGFVLCGVSTDRCDFLVVEGSEEGPSFFALAERDVGLVQFETISADSSTSLCLYWFDDPEASAQLYDHVWHAARVMSVTASFLALFFVGFICTISCVSYSAIVFQRLAFASLIIPLLYGLSFIVLGSDVCLTGSCGVGIGGMVLVLGILVWLMLAAVLYLIPGRTVPGHKGQSDVQRYLRSGQLGAAILMVIFIVALVNLLVVFGRSPPGADDATAAPTEAPSSEEVLGWLQEGEPVLGPFPDSHDYLTLAGNGEVMSLIGKESVLVMEHDEERKLWYPLGNMVSANDDSTGWDPEDRISKVKATASSLSNSGFTLAVGSNNWAEGTDGKYEFGRVQIWQYSESSKRWITKGHPITGMAKGDAFAAKLQLSSDGSRLAVVATGQFGRHEPYARIYEYNDITESTGNWVQLGQDVRLESFWTSSGFAFSGSGESFALGSLRIGRLGLVTVWHYDEQSKTWVRRGSPISAGSSKREDKFGGSVAMSHDGMAVLVGDSGGTPAYARAFWFNGKGWEQLGQDLECNLDGRCANDVAMSKFGSMVAITGFHSFNQVARVYSLDGPQTKWLKVGGDIQGPKSDKSIEGTSIGISGDGRTVAFGTTLVRDTQTQVWRYTGGMYIDVPLESNLASEVPTTMPVTNNTVPSSAPSTWSNGSHTVSPTGVATTELMMGNLSTAVPSDNATGAEEIDAPQATNSTSNSSSLWDYASVQVAVQNDTESTLQPLASSPPQEWIRAHVMEDFVFFLFDSFPPRIERYNLTSGQFIPATKLRTDRGPPRALGIDESLQMYVGYGTQVYRYGFDGGNETRVAAEAFDLKSDIQDFLFDGDLVFINAGQNFISVNGKTNTMIKNVFSYNELVLGTSISSRHRRLFGRTPVEVAPASGDVIRQSELWFKEYDAQGRFVSEKVTGSAVDVETAFKTWIFPDQTRVIDDMGYVFSVTTNNAEHVYTLDIPEILDIAWVEGDAMVTLHTNGTLSLISEELVPKGSLQLDYAPGKIAIKNERIVTFTHDVDVDNGIRIDMHSLDLLNLSLTGQPMPPSGVPFTPTFSFVDRDGRLYMTSKGHASIFVMEPKEKSYVETIKLDEIPKYVAYSSVNHQVYTLRENGVLSKIDLTGQNRSEAMITIMPSTPFGLSTAGKFIFVCDDAGSFATHYTFLNNGTLVSAVDWNHVDKEYVWSEVNRKMYFFRQANPTDLMTEHIFSNGTIGVRVDSYLNNNSGFEHPIRVDPAGHRAVLGSGIVHNARTLKRLNVSLSNPVLDIAFNKGVARTIRQSSPTTVQLQEWHERTFQMLRVTEVSGRAHHLFALDENKTVAVVSNETGIPTSYVLDEHFSLL